MGEGNIIINSNFSRNKRVIIIIVINGIFVLVYLILSCYV